MSESLRCCDSCVASHGELAGVYTVCCVHIQFYTYWLQALRACRNIKTDAAVTTRLRRNCQH